MKGRFIVLEGIDGSGTTTQTKLLASRLFDLKGMHLLLTREPTRDENCRELTDLLVGKDPRKDAGVFLDAFFADRTRHLSNYIHPNLARGITVLSDRYSLSTFAYQVAQGLRFEDILRIHNGLLVPDLTILIDLDAEVAMKRMGSRADTEVFEHLDFQRVVRANYLEFARYFSGMGQHIAVIDGNRPKEVVNDEIYNQASQIF